VAVPVLFADADCISCVRQMVCLCVLLSEVFWRADAQEVETFLVIRNAVTGASAVVQVA
jgi:hypothetical protein